jgi:Helix-turn-helix domain
VTPALTQDRVRLAELPGEVLLTPREVAAWLGLSVRQVQRLSIPYIDCGERNRRYRVADVRAWLERRRRGAAA